MELSEKQLNSFITLYKDQFGIQLSRVQALEEALRVLRYVGISVIPIPSVLEMQQERVESPISSFDLLDKVAQSE